ncbi:hypothetical protein CEXT_255641 [Caerostris extrusa]|uniref:Uncharacterized protein n=1 Tax=Caerostris extrusa TaxID=172846 RepID=A0AAV4QEH7_CAEEX|nr:hypothetical protein CEXT_255641 [Caerostris extrusa]
MGRYSVDHIFNIAPQKEIQRSYVWRSQLPSIESISSDPSLLKRFHLRNDKKFESSAVEHHPAGISYLVAKEYMGEIKLFKHAKINGTSYSS